MNKVFSVKSLGEGKLIILLNDGKNTNQIKELLSSSENFDSSKIDDFVSKRAMYFFRFRIIDIVKKLNGKIVGIDSKVLFLGAAPGRPSKEIEKVRTNMPEKEFISRAPLDVRYYGDERVR